MRFPFTRDAGAIAFFAFLAPLFALRAQVVVNEISSVQSARLLQKPAGALPRLGALPAWHENDFAVPAWWGSGPGPFGFGYAQATTHPVAADDVTLDALETIDLSAWQPANLESETVDALGLLRATWRSQNGGAKVFVRLRARLN